MHSAFLRTYLLPVLHHRGSQRPSGQAQRAGPGRLLDRLEPDPDLLESRKDQLGPTVLSREAKMAARSATVGARAPDFSLPITMGPGSERRLASLVDYQDRWLMLLFYPRDFSLV